MATTIAGKPPLTATSPASARGGGGSGAPWTFVGLASSLPNIDSADEHHLAAKRPCGGGSGSAPGCRVFRIPRPTTTTGSGGAVYDEEVEEVAPEDAGSAAYLRSMGDQVLVFRYRGKLHAVDNRCPHSSYPLSKGTPFEIEDFGVVLSSGLACPQHGWSFDLHTGQADRGSYRLGVWEVELRPVGPEAAPRREREGEEEEKKKEEEEGQDDDDDDKEVWVRRK